MAQALRAVVVVGVLVAALAVAAAERADGAPTPAACAPKELVELPANAWAPARKQLAPPGASAVRLCRYNALNTKPPLALAGSALVTSAKSVKAIVAELDALRPLPRGIFCPLDDGAAINALLAYSGGHAVLVRFELTGCGTVSNGNVTRWAGNSTAGSDLVALIERLTGYKRAGF